MRKIFLLLAIIFFTGEVCSQQQKIDSLLLKIEKAKSLNEKVKELNELSRFYIYYSPQVAIKYANKAFTLSQEASYKKGEIISKINIGFYYLRIDDYKNARKILREARAAAKETRNLVTCGEACYLLARVNNGLGRYDFSMQKLIEAEKYYDTARFQKYMGRVYETMGDLNDKFGNYQLAIKNLQKSLNLKKKHKDFIELPRTYAYLGNVNLHKNQPEIALSFYNKALRASENSHNLNSKGYCLTKLGDFYLLNNEYKKSRAFYERSLKISYDHQNNWGLFRNELGLSKSDFKLKLYSKSLEMALKAIKIAEKIKDDEGLMNGYKLLSDIYEKTGEIKKAYESFKKANSYEESLFDSERTAEITMNEVQHKQKIEINKLNTEQRQKAEQQKQKQKQKDIIAQKEQEASQKIGVLLIIFLIVVLIFAVFQYNRYLAIKKQKKIIETQTNQNLILMKSISSQDMVSTVGEISSNIAHELNSPLGTVKSSAEGIEYAFKRLITNKAWDCTPKEVDYALNYVTQKPVRTILLGKHKIKETQIFLNILEKNQPGKKENKKLAELFSASIADSTDKEVISYVLKTKNPISFLKLVKNINTVLFFIQANLSSSKRVANKVAELRSYLKLDNKEKKKKIDISKNLLTIVDLYRYEIEKSITLNLNINSKEEIEAYPIMLHQLWSNILKNALEALEKKKEKKTLKINVYSNNSILNVEFINNGPKINESQKKLIFENLYTTKEKGSGLGLGIVKNVIDAHRAKIDFDSNEEQTVFKITFYKN